ncbi:MAG: hypothetical protein ACRCXT_02005 [Paraclostridium sp.]
MLKNLESIILSDLYQYLYNNGWNEINTELNNSKRFEKTYDGDIFMLILPKNDKVSDYKQRIYEAINTLSELEDIEVNSLLGLICEVNIDKMDIRLVSEDFNKGTIPLNIANNIIPFTREIIISSACVEENPRARYNKPTKKALEYGDIFKLGQTKVGSYIISVEADLGMSEDDDIPFERRILDRVQESIYQIVNSDDCNINECYKNGLNSNICDAFAKLKDIKQHIDIEYNFIKSKTIKDNKKIPTKVSINNEVFEKAEKLSVKFKEIQVNEEVSIVGKIKNIDLYSIDEGNKSGYLTVNVIYLDEKKKRNIKIYVEGEKFDLACDAFKDHLDVEVTGLLDKSARTWCIDDVKSFDVKYII